MKTLSVLLVILAFVVVFQNCAGGSGAIEPIASASQSSLEKKETIELGPGNGDLYDGKPSFVFVGRQCQDSKTEGKIVVESGFYMQTRDNCRQIEPRLVEPEPHELGISYNRNVYLEKSKVSDDIILLYQELIVDSQVTAQGGVFTLRSDADYPLSCSIDNEVEEFCESQISYSQLRGGPHNFRVSMVDLEGRVISTEEYHWNGVHTIVGNGIGRNWSDGSFANSCNGYKNPERELFSYEGDIGDGTYTIERNGSVFEVYCDMSTDAGGWTRVIHSQSSLNDLAAFGDTGQIKGSFYSSESLGLGWNRKGSGSSWKDQSFNFSFEYTQVKIVFSGKYNNPTGGIGRLKVSSSARAIIRFSDSHRFGTAGQSLAVGSKTIYSEKSRNEVNREETIDLGTLQRDLQITMSTYQSYPYTKRFIRELWLK